MIGTVLQNRYEIREKITEGGMSVIYKAWCRKNQDFVVIKVLKDELQQNPEAVQAFRKEAFTTAKLSHDNIVKVIDVGKEKGITYIVMEYLHGDSLKKYASERGINLKKYVHIVSALLNALSYAHKRGVIHKDIKPDNIIMTHEEEPVIIDFGIAEEMSEEDEHKLVRGTLHYFSPEQAKGEAIDERSDIYSIGILLYELCTGTLPFTGKDGVSIALKHLHQPAVPPKEINPDIPESLNKIILRAIAKEVSDRYQNADSMRKDLARCFFEKDGAYVEETKKPEKQENRQKKKGLLKLGIALAVGGIAVLVLAFLFISFISRENKKNEPIIMPFLTDDTEKQALKELKEFGVSPDIIYEYSIEVPEGKVIEQIPEAGTVIQEDTEVQITISSATLDSTTMPNLIGLTEEKAILLMMQYGLKEENIIVKRKSARGKTSGEVIKQTPKEQERIEENITIVVAE